VEGVDGVREKNLPNCHQPSPTVLQCRHTKLGLMSSCPDDISPGSYVFKSVHKRCNF
jgi:hypothetical protein